ncbi:zinc finger protein 62-like [Armigeres subalbatus]|uniref:zinc finger protein 62-like n=1 Tax=Armigeres subalbatus TaxID=124917 RepID=UPI002ED48356
MEIHEEYAAGLPAYLCNTCARQIEGFTNFKRQALCVLKFAIALLASRQKNDPQPMVDLYESDKSGQIRHILNQLKLTDNEELSIEHLLGSIRNNRNIEIIDKEVIFEEVSVDIESDHDNDIESENAFSESDTPEPISKSGKSVNNQIKRSNSKAKRRIIRKDGQKFKLCQLEGCGEEYLVGNRVEYVQHEKNFHRYGCNVCGRVLASRTSFRNHVLLHDGEEVKAKCEFCGRAFTTKGSMMVHIREVHNNTGVHFNCQYCGKGFMEQKDLNAHLHNHKSCEICDKSFSDLPGWINHNRKHHPETLFTCDYCEHTSLSQSLLDRHKRMKHSENSNEQLPQRFTIFAINSAAFHQCPQCKFQFTNNDFLLQHNEQVHNRRQVDKQDRPIQRRSKEEREKFDLRYSCETCGKKYRFKNSLWSHRHKEHNVDQSTAICDICGQNFKHQSYLAAHMANKHVTECPFRCDRCPKAYSQAYLLKEHAKCHDTEKRHKCSHCDYRAKQSHMLKDHVSRMHTTERPAKCNECDRAFINNSELKKHMAIHSSEMHFQCEQCEQVFRRKMDLARHRTRMHTEIGAKKRKAEIAKQDVDVMISTSEDASTKAD